MYVVFQLTPFCLIFIAAQGFLLYAILTCFYCTLFLPDFNGELQFLLYIYLYICFILFSLTFFAVAVLCSVLSLSFLSVILKLRLVKFKFFLYTLLRMVATTKLGWGNSFSFHFCTHTQVCAARGIQAVAGVRNTL